MTIKEMVEFQIRSSRWAKWIGNDYLQTLAAKYYVWKVKRRVKRYNKSVKECNELIAKGKLPQLNRNLFTVNLQ